MITKVRVCDVIIFRFNRVYIKYSVGYSVNEISSGYYLKNCGLNSNGEIFEKLRIIDRYKFASEVYGYELNIGTFPYSKKEFPYAKTKEDLVKLINKLYDVIRDVRRN